MSVAIGTSESVDLLLPRWEETSATEYVDQLIELMISRGSTFYDDEVTQLEHALQGAFLADRANDAEHAIAAALLHDIGHLLVHEHSSDSGFLQSDLEHEAIGARWLETRFPPSVTQPIAEHVRAKRYLCTVDENYWSRLSRASQYSFELQGGALSLKELELFESHPAFRDAVTLRWRDEAAKVAGRDVPPLETYRSLLESLVV
ncbi:MAG: HDIG domain-containing metalloprotein [Pseudomonadota bacterium]